MVEVHAVLEVDVLVFEITISVAAPRPFTLPSMVTLLAEFNRMRGPAIFPVMVNPDEVG